MAFVFIALTLVQRCMFNTGVCCLMLREFKTSDTSSAAANVSGDRFVAGLIK